MNIVTFFSFLFRKSDKENTILNNVKNNTSGNDVTKEFSNVENIITVNEVSNEPDNIENYNTLFKLKNYNSIIYYFSQYRFGSEQPVLTFLSALPPIDRCCIIENVLKNDLYNHQAYDKLSLAYLKNGEKFKAFNLLDNALKNKYIDSFTFQTLKNNLIQLDNMYNGSYGSSINYEETIQTLKSRVDEYTKRRYSHFYNLIIQFAYIRTQIEKGKEPIYEQHATSTELKKKNFSFKPIRYEVWQNGKRTSFGKTNTTIEATVITSIDTEKSAVCIVLNDDKLNPLILNKFEFDRYISKSDRIMLLTIPKNESITDCRGLKISRNFDGVTRDKKIFNELEPFASSIYTVNSIISKMTFSFNYPERLIEFY